MVLHEKTHQPVTLSPAFLLQSETRSWSWTRKPRRQGLHHSGPHTDAENSARATIRYPALQDCLAILGWDWHLFLLGQWASGEPAGLGTGQWAERSAALGNEAGKRRGGRKRVGREGAGPLQSWKSWTKFGSELFLDSALGTSDQRY